MKAIIRFYSTMSSSHCIKPLTAVIIIASMLSYKSASAQSNITWIGKGTLNGSNTVAGQNFNNPLNWDLLRVPSAADNVFIPFTKDGIVNLNVNTTIRNLTITNDKNNNTCVLNVGANTLTVNGNTSIEIIDDHPHNEIYIGVTDATSAGIIDFVGNVVMGSNNLNDAVYIVGNTNSTIICRSNFTLGTKTQVVAGAEPGTLLFDGTGTQNFIFNNTQSCGFKNVVIGSTNNPTVIMGGTSTPDNIVGNLTVNGSSILDLNTRQLNRNSNGGNLFIKNTATLRVAGLSSSSNSGLISGSNFPSGFTNIVLDSSSTVEFYGTTQAIPGAAQLIKGYGNLTLVNSTKTLSSSFAMFRNLNIAANTTMALGNFDDTLKSNSQTTAHIPALPTTAALTYGTGGFVVERYLSANKAWRLLATPVDIATSPTISASWREGNSVLNSTGFGTQITGPQGPSAASSSAMLDVYTARGSVKSYNPAIDNYVEVTNANTTKIANTAGYYVFVRGDRGVGITGAAGSTTLRIKGRIRTGNQSFTVPTNKFASVGNPFPSRIDFRTIYNSSISPSYYVWNPGAAGTYNVGKYEVYVNYGDGNYRIGGPAGSIRNYIESGQAVFIQSITGGTITVKESDKIGGSSLVSRGGESARQGITTPTLEINLIAKDGSGSDVLADAAVLNFDASYSNDIDNMDVRKIVNSYDNLSIRKGSINLVLESRPTLNVTDTIFLNMSNTRIGNYRLNIDPSMLMNSTLEAFIKDKFLQTETPVSFTEVTDYTFATTSDAASRAADRFMIVFKLAPPTTNFTTIAATRNADKSITVNWGTQNETRLVNYTIERSNDGVNFSTIASEVPSANNGGNPTYSKQDANANIGKNWYRVKANNLGGTAKYSAIAMVNEVLETIYQTTPIISIYPNPVVNGIINLYFNNKTAGKYSVTVLDNTGKSIKTATVDVLNNEAVERIQIAEASSGLYSVIVKDAQGNKISIPFVKL